MLFRLKNARATYQRLMDKVLAKLMEKIIEAYVGDMVVKSLEVVKHSPDLQELFDTLSQY